MDEQFRQVLSLTAVAGNPLMASPRGMSEVMEKALRGYVLLKAGDSAQRAGIIPRRGAGEASLPMPFSPPMTIEAAERVCGRIVVGDGEAGGCEEGIRDGAEPDRRGGCAAMIGLARSKWALGNRAAAGRFYKTRRDLALGRRGVLSTEAREGPNDLACPLRSARLL